jgi:hypothetical protein
MPIAVSLTRSRFLLETSTRPLRVRQAACPRGGYTDGRVIETQ